MRAGLSRPTLPDVDLPATTGEIRSIRTASRASSSSSAIRGPVGLDCPIRPTGTTSRAPMARPRRRKATPPLFAICRQGVRFRPESSVDGLSAGIRRRDARFPSRCFPMQRDISRSALELPDLRNRRRTVSTRLTFFATRRRHPPSALSGSRSCWRCGGDARSGSHRDSSARRQTRSRTWQVVRTPVFVL